MRTCQELRQGKTRQRDPDASTRPLTCLRLSNISVAFLPDRRLMHRSES